MLCDICQKKHATIHLTEIVNEKVVELHICQACAQDKTKSINEQLNISGFLGGFPGAQEAKSKGSVSPVCRECGFSFDDFKKKGRLGCGFCYTAFREQLLPLIKKIHGSARHAGRAAVFSDKKETIFDIEMEECRKRLERAIQLEEYEEAASLRDQIKKILERKKDV